MHRREGATTGCAPSSRSVLDSVTAHTLHDSSSCDVCADLACRGVGGLSVTHTPRANHAVIRGQPRCRSVPVHGAWHGGMRNRTQNRQSRCKKRRGLRCGCGACPADEHKDAAAEQHSCERCGDTLAPLACRQRQLVRLAAVLVPEQNTRPRHESAAHDGDERGHDLRWHQGLCSVHRQGSPQRSSGKEFRGDGTCAATEVGLARVHLSP